ncbi:metallophosphoesterase family protein [Lichenihabitans sp. PAMC28606]|uniref:metallophosphoesterase family protein n=1 Tax=Lichenihabitans TaxID=2723776 RepID=UPI001038526F|nr:MULTISPECIES: metallophosphoesterase family protein [Lichenihabitans]UDL95832.1 metallophosphoesterase family protein [Lichenihabitans sp. PAMC28606]
MTVFFTSDTHFGDPRALRFDHRPFLDLDLHDAGLIDRWNAAVSADDLVWHLGDFALGPTPDRVAEIFGALNGEKHLIVGNNDGPATLALPGWASQQHYAEVTVDGTMLVLCHYAFRTWNGMGRGSLNLHGHSHGALRKAPKQYDVGVDVWDFRPVTLEDIRTTRRRAVAATSER